MPSIPTALRAPSRRTLAIVLGVAAGIALLIGGLVAFSLLRAPQPADVWPTHLDAASSALTDFSDAAAVGDTTALLAACDSLADAASDGLDERAVGDSDLQEQWVATMNTLTDAASNCNTAYTDANNSDALLATVRALSEGRTGVDDLRAAVEDENN